MMAEVLIRTIIILAIYLSTCIASECDKNPIFCQIVKNKPSIDRKYAMEISNNIHKMHIKYGINKEIFTAILMQESGYSLEAKGRLCGLNSKLKEECVHTDYGISQIHYKTAALWGFDINKLTNDLEYSIEAGAKVLHYFRKRYKSREPSSYWTRYNCGTKQNVNREICKQYKERVSKYL